MGCAVCCSALQRRLRYVVRVCFSVIQCVAVCCCELQWVDVLQYLAAPSCDMLLVSVARNVVGGCSVKGVEVKCEMLCVSCTSHTFRHV